MSNKNVSVLLGFIILMVVCLLGCSSTKNKDNSNLSLLESLKTEFDTKEGKIELLKTNVLSEKVEILLPRQFSIMSDEMAKLKYPNERRPTLIYTNETGSINIAFNHTESKTTNEEIEEYKEYLKESLKKMYPSAEWYDAGIIKLSSSNVGYFELLTPALDTEIYNLMFFTELDGRLLLVTVNCVKEQMDDWKPIANNIMRSYKIIQ